jgi:hypothetical protein
MERHADRVAALRRAVFESSGSLTPELRRAAAEQRVDALPAPLRAYVEKIERHAYKITDEDVAALQAAGYSDDQLFELTVAAAAGAGLRRLDAGLAALRGGAKR